MAEPSSQNIGTPVKLCGKKNNKSIWGHKEKSKKQQCSHQRHWRTVSMCSTHKDRFPSSSLRWCCGLSPCCPMGNHTGTDINTASIGTGGCLMKELQPTMSPCWRKFPWRTADRGEETHTGAVNKCEKEGEEENYGGLTTTTSLRVKIEKLRMK